MTTVTIAETQTPRISLIQVNTNPITLETNVISNVSASYIQGIAGAMWSDTSSVDITYNNIAQTLIAAVRVDNYTILIDGTGNNIYSPNGVYHEHAYSGADMTNLPEPSTGRILTIPNTHLTKSISIWMDGFFMHPGVSITISHLSANSTVTFLGNTFDSQSIWAVWYE